MIGGSDHRLPADCLVDEPQPSDAPRRNTVVDANLVLALMLPFPHSGLAADALRARIQARDRLYAPALLEYEVCSALRRAVTLGILPSNVASEALELLTTLRIKPITPASSLHGRALGWAARLGHSKSYDAQYMALAEELGCELLTADLRLTRSAQALGVDWVVGVDTCAEETIDGGGMR